MHAEELRRRMAEASGRPVWLKVNQNARALLTFRPRRPGPGLMVSVHRMFLEAPEPVLNALIDYVATQKDAPRETVRKFIADKHAAMEITAKPRRAKRNAYRGRHYDVAARAAAVNERYFGGVLEFGVEWTEVRPPRGKRKQRNVTLGHWDATRRTVRLHPMLDDPFVPEYYFDYVVFHELCHIAVPSTATASGKMLHHSAAFRNAERSYPMFREAQAWEQKNLTAMIERWRKRPRTEDEGGSEGSSTVRRLLGVALDLFR